MNNREHERAIEVITRSDVDEVAAADAAWLDSHLATCAECAEYAALVNSTGRLLRSVAVTASPALVATTQARLRARALEMREREARMFLIGISFCLGLVWSALSAAVWWKVAGWLAHRYDVPVTLVQPGLVVLWLLPAVALAVLLLNHPRLSSEDIRPVMLHREREGEIR